MAGARKVGGLWALLRYLRGRESGVSLKVLAFFVVVYLILPSDLVPDVVPVIGWLDDIGLLAALAAFITNRYHEYRKHHVEKPPSDENSLDERGSDASVRKPPTTTPAQDRLGR